MGNAIVRKNTQRALGLSASAIAGFKKTIDDLETANNILAGEMQYHADQMNAHSSAYHHIQENHQANTATVARMRSLIEGD